MFFEVATFFHWVEVNNLKNQLPNIEHYDQTISVLSHEKTCYFKFEYEKLSLWIKEREREREREREKWWKSVSVCVCVCVCGERERERNGKKWCEFTVLSNMSPSMISVGYSGDLSIGGFYISFISTLFLFSKNFFLHLQQQICFLHFCEFFCNMRPFTKYVTQI